MELPPVIRRFVRTKTFCGEMFKTLRVLLFFIAGMGALTWLNIFPLGRGDQKFGQTDYAFQLYLTIWWAANAWTSYGVNARPEHVSDDHSRKVAPSAAGRSRAQ